MYELQAQNVLLINRHKQKHTKKETEKEFVHKLLCTFTCVNIKYIYKMRWCTNL